MFCAEEYMHQLIENLLNSFGDRLYYVGLQGSYMRGDATENSDIDPMVVIDDLCVDDLDVYKQIIFQMEYPEKSCGFICGMQELRLWNPLEICQLIHSTKDYYGCLLDLVPTYTKTDVRNFVLLSVNNLYHEITHRYLHASMEKNIARITSSYKNVFFILQNLHYLETGNFVLTKRELARCLNDGDAEILNTAIALSNGAPLEFDVAFSLLYRWCQTIMHRLSA